MRFFIDSAKIEEIDDAFIRFGISGVTTNPVHIKAGGQTLSQFIDSITRWLKTNDLIGNDVFPVFLEVNPHYESAQEIVSAAEAIAEQCENFVIKVPPTPEGISATRILSKKKVSVAVTLVFTLVQAMVAAFAGPTYIATFISWQENKGLDTASFIQNTLSQIRKRGLETRVLAASVKTGKHMNDALVAGAEYLTCGYSVYEGIFDNPYTVMGLNMFKQAWNSTEIMSEG